MAVDRRASWLKGTLARWLAFVHQALLRADSLLIISGILAVIAIGRVLSATTAIHGGGFDAGAVAGAGGALAAFLLLIRNRTR